MDSSLVGILLTDHEMVRSLYQELKQECRRTDTDADHCLNLFRHLKAFAVAHAKAEEFVLYELIEDPKAKLSRDLEHFAFEGYEENDLMDFLMKEMGQAEELSPQWRAQLVVLGDMLERHFLKEEEELYPRLKAVLTDQQSLDLGKAYAKEREVVFAKKSGLRPVLSMAPLAPH